MSGSSNTEKHSFGPLGISDLFGVEGFKCVVTGGGTGIGLMVAQGLARNGATVYITGRRKEALEKVCKEYNDPKHGGKIIAMACDITDKAQLKSLAEEIGKKEPHGMNLLVNNAGVAVEDSTKGKQPDDFGSVDKVYSWLWNADQSEWDETLKINVTAQYFATAAFIPLLAKGAETKSGHSPSVVNITSVAGVLKNMMQGQFAYAASKAAFIHLNRNLANALAGLRIRVNSIAPGLFPSEMTEQKPADSSNQKSYLPQGERPWPAKRAGDEADIVSTVIYLASNGGNFHNGHTIYLDGGLTMTAPSAA